MKYAGALGQTLNVFYGLYNFDRLYTVYVHLALLKHWVSKLSSSKNPNANSFK